MDEIRVFTVPTGSTLKNLGDGQFLVTHPDGRLETIAVWMEPGVGTTVCVDPATEEDAPDAA